MKRRCGIIAICALLAMVLNACCIHIHGYSEWTVKQEATCKSAGTRVRVCDCGKEITEEIPLTDHNYIAGEKTASCTDDGKITYVCLVCGDTYSEAAEQKTYTPTEIYEMYVNSVGEVVTYQKNGQELSLGSCFVYTADGKLITNYHVIEDAYSAKVTVGGQTYDVEQVLAYDKNIDAAVLKISATGLPPATLCELEHKVGQSVYAFGNSKGLTSTFSDGMITYSKRVNEGVSYVQHDAPISGGNSGGPLINVYGEVIGINTMTVVDSQNLNFAICMEELKKLDYSTPLTMRQFYDKEANAYKKMANYIMQKGVLSDDIYFLELDVYYSSNYTSTYMIDAAYDPANQEVWLIFNIDNRQYAYFTVKEDVTGVYKWAYFDDDDYEMSGSLTAATYNSNTLLGYDYNNLRNATMRSAIRELASAMISETCKRITGGFAEIGVTAADLGFANYS